mmetsp:Transcript_15530/g.38281  ORF Transcript_15530/g.38281 Transcript_15530/m.38281 type:complete len:631 (-) Transcript_15530:2546-4438(-)
MSRKQWEQQHPKGKDGVPTRLFTDENPATTIKGTGFRDKRIAERTIQLTSQPGVRYKQYWTIKAMRERAFHHPHKTDGMRDAIEVFDKWLKEEEGKPALSEEESKLRREEWKQFQTLCQSAANEHSYGNEPTQSELKRARDDLKNGQDCLLRGLELSQKKSSNSFLFPLVAFTALFGAPGLHGYGRHTIEGDQSLVSIDGKDGLQELVSNKSALSRYGDELQRISLTYNRKNGTAEIKLEFDKKRMTLSRLWDGVRKDTRDAKATTLVPSKQAWSCTVCTFEHAGEDRQLYLACEICGAPRQSPSVKKVTPNKKETTRKVAHATKNNSSHDSEESLKDTRKAAWGTLRPPTSRDVQGPRKRQKGLDAPIPLLDYIVVMDFEWTADNKSKMEPIAEITQFPAVVMKLEDRKWGTGVKTASIPKSPIALPADLCTPCFSNRIVNADAYAVSAFDTFVKPTFNPTLTKFSIELTAIQQTDVDNAPSIGPVVNEFVRWLQSLGLVDADRKRVGNWCFATWGDGDIAGTLRQELEFKSLSLPPCFDRWIDLKNDAIFLKHYGREPRGGLRKCVESVGAVWSGRAHNGLVDSFNTAKIVRHMVQTGFRFIRPTRGLDRNGAPFGQRRKQNGKRERI